MIDTPLSWIVAPILAQRNIELSEVSVAFKEYDRTSEFTLRAADGTMAVFSIPVMSMSGCRDAVEVAALLRPIIETVEFTHGEPVIPEIQPTGPEPDSGVSETPAETLSDEGAAFTASDPAGGPEAQADAEGEGLESGQPVESTGGSSE